MINQDNIKQWLENFIENYLDKYCPAEGWYDKVDRMVSEAKTEAKEVLSLNFLDVNMAYELSSEEGEADKNEIINIINQL